MAKSMQKLKRRKAKARGKKKQESEVALPDTSAGQVSVEQASECKSLGKGPDIPKKKNKKHETAEVQNVNTSSGAGSVNTFEVEFEFFDPEEDDFHSVRDLLCSGTLGTLDLDFSSLANSIVDQVNIGTMVKSGVDDSKETPTEEDDVTLCGMLTVLNLRQFTAEAWCKNLTAILENKLKLDKHLLEYIRASGKDQVGLIISERFVNLPLEVIPAMHKAILEDISWSCSTEYCPPEERPFYFFTHFICLARCQAVSSAAQLEGLQTFQLKDGVPLLFSRAEELALAQASSFVSSFPQSSKDGASAFQPQPNKKRKAEQGALIKGQAGIDFAAPGKIIQDCSSSEAL